jgi:hypothetical protein
MRQHRVEFKLSMPGHKSNGFSGYEWMVDNILRKGDPHGETILSVDVRPLPRYCACKTCGGEGRVLAEKREHQ